MTTRQLAEQILTAIREVKQQTWSEYNVLSGRSEDKVQPLEKAQLHAVICVLEKNGVWPEMNP